MHEIDQLNQKNIEDSFDLLDFIDDEYNNHYLLRKLYIAREHFWNYIFHIKKKFENFEIKVLNSICVNCNAVLEKNKECCDNCNSDLLNLLPTYTSKTPVGSPGKGKKQCSHCSSFVAARTIICKICGYHFYDKLVTEIKKEKIVVSKNKKHKKHIIVKIKQINDASILIENDKTLNNISIFRNHIKDNTLFDESSRLAFKCIFETKNEIIMNNINLVRDIAYKTCRAKRSVLKHLKIEDLIQVGCIGLIKAVDKFDIHKKYKINNEEKLIAFSTYANYWITREILKSIIVHDKTIRLPDHIVNKYKSFSSYYNSYISQNNEKPDLSTIIKDLNISKKNAEALLFAINLDSSYLDIDMLSKDKVNDAQSKEYTFLIKMLYNLGLYHTEEYKSSESLMNIINDIKFKTICTNEKNVNYKDVFLDVFGFNGCEYTLDQIASKYGISKVTVMKIRDDNLEKLKNRIEEIER